MLLYALPGLTDITLRGLAHPLHYETPFGELFEKYGAVQANARNCYKLLQHGQSILLYPGGAREVAKRRGEEYKLMWKSETDFVRLAMRFNATIVPFAALGIDDAFDITLEPEEILSSPMGPIVKELLNSAGIGGNSANLIDLVDAVPPVAVGLAGLPFVPQVQRLYFRFGDAIPTDGFTKNDLQNRELCQQLYHQVRQSVEDSIDLLKEKRASDPLRELLPRTIVSACEMWDGS